MPGYPTTGTFRAGDPIHELDVANKRYVDGGSPSGNGTNFYYCSVVGLDDFRIQSGFSGQLVTGAFYGEASGEKRQLRRVRLYAATNTTPYQGLLTLVVNFISATGTTELLRQQYAIDVSTRNAGNTSNFLIKTLDLEQIFTPSVAFGIFLEFTHTTGSGGFSVISEWNNDIMPLKEKDEIARMARLKSYGYRENVKYNPNPSGMKNKKSWIDTLLRK